MPRIVHVHAKFYDIDEAGNEPAIDYPELVRVFVEGGYSRLLLQRVGGPRVRRPRRGRPDRPGAQAARPHPPLDHGRARRPVSPRLELRALCRVVVDNDFSGDPDGLLALAHHLLAPSNQVVLVTSSFLNQSLPGPHPTAADGATLAAELVEVVGGPTPSVVAGSERAFDPDAGAPSAAADAIVAEARRDDPLPLYVVCGGPLTNVAEALRAAPDIAERFTLVWIGGSIRDGVFEYNRDTDPAAAAFVLGHARAGRAPVPARGLPPLRVLDRRAGAGRRRRRPARPVALDALHQPAGLDRARRCVAAGRQPAAAGHGAHRRVQHVHRDTGRAGAWPAADLHRRRLPAASWATCWPASGCTSAIARGRSTRQRTGGPSR